MVAALLIYAVAAGVAIVELLAFADRRIGFARRLADVNAGLKAFQAAQDDDTRQALLLRTGMRTLAVSLLLLLTLAMAGLVMAAPLPLQAFTTTDMTLYMVVMTVAALAWWRLRRPRA